MKQTELKLGEAYKVSYMGDRCVLIEKGQGHGPVHRVRILDPETGETLKNDDGTDKTRKCSSRDIQYTWERLLQCDPEYLNRLKQQRVDRENRRVEEQLQADFVDHLKEVCEQTAGLMVALGFEAKVLAVNAYAPEQGFFIRIDNPTENQELLRKMVAEKWSGAFGDQG